MSDFQVSADDLADVEQLTSKIMEYFVDVVSGHDDYIKKSVTLSFFSTILVNVCLTQRSCDNFIEQLREVCKLHYDEKD